MSEELWKDTPGYEGWYQAHPDGLIRGIYREISRIGRTKFIMPQLVMSLDVAKTGYQSVRLSRGRGHRRKFLVHRLLAMTFISNPENKPQVNHKNGIKGDNRIENLEWTTMSENLQHRVKVLGVGVGDTCVNSKLRSEQIYLIRLLNFHKFGQTVIGNMFNVSMGSIGPIIRKKTWVGVGEFVDSK